MTRTEWRIIIGNGLLGIAVGYAIHLLICRWSVTGFVIFGVLAALFVLLDYD